MADDEIFSESPVPSFKDFDEPPIFTEATRTDVPPQPQIIRRKPGRPKGSTNKPKFEVHQGGLTGSTRPIGTDARDKIDKQISFRAQQLLLGATGVASILRSSIKMTPQEAQNISDPFAAWATKQGEPTGMAKEILDRWDVIAIFIGLLAYGVRVIKEEQQLARESRDNAKDGAAVLTNSKGAVASARRTTAAPPDEEENGGFIDPQFGAGHVGFSAPPAPGF